MSASGVPLEIRARPASSGFAQGSSRIRWTPTPARSWGIRLIAVTIGIWLASVALGFEKGVLLLTLLGFAAAVGGLARPALGLLGVVILCTLDPVSRMYLMTGGLLRWNTFNYWLVVVMLLYVGSLARLKDPQIRLLQVFIGLLTLELALSTDLVGGAQHVLNLVTIFGLLIYVARARSDPGVWYWSAMLSGVLAGLGSLVFYAEQDLLPPVNANAWSFFPLTSLFVTCVYAASPARRRRSRLLLILAFVNAGWVFLSGSRGSFLICVVCLLFILIRLHTVKGTGLTLAAAVLGAMAVASQFGEQESRAVFRLTKLFDQERSLTDRTSGRWDLAVGGWEMFLEHPLGVGTGGFPHAWASFSNRRGISAFRGWEKQAHSGWIKVLVENGIPGILVFGGFVLSFALLGWRRRRAGMFLPGLVVTLILSVAFLADEFQGKGLWYLCGAVILFGRLAPVPAAGVRPSRRAVG